MRRYVEDGERMTAIVVSDLGDVVAKEAELDKCRQHLEELVEKRTADLVATVSKLETANRDLESFAYSVSHDLRTPLRAVDGFSKILLEDYADKLDAEGQRVLNVVRDSTARMSRLIEDILSFSRVGRAEISQLPMDMEAVVRSALNELKPSTANRNVTFDVGTLPPSHGDAAKIQRVWINLLDNAINFTGPKPEAKIKVGATAGVGETIYYVADDGVGFDKQYVWNLFTLFQRLHGAKFPGTGAGLAIVKRIIGRHGRRVWAEGKPNEGATFYFTLPERESAIPSALEQVLGASRK